jgi:hypothetical protein
LAHGVSSLALGPAPARRNIAGTRVSGPLVRPYRFCQNQKRFSLKRNETVGAVDGLEMWLGQRWAGSA